MGAFQNKDQIGMMSGRKTLEVNANHPVVVDLLTKVKADKEDAAALDTAQVSSRLLSSSQVTRSQIHLLWSTEYTASCQRSWELTLMHRSRRSRFPRRRKKLKRKRRQR